MATSFQKKTRIKAVQILGTKPSLHNNQLLVSTGVPSLDNVIGGGLAVGTVLMVEEDTYSSYSRLLLRYFLAEGILSKHALCVASADNSPASLLKDLPGPLIDDPGKSEPPPADSTKEMTIAWRYQNQPQVQSSCSSSRFGHYYDLTKTMDPLMVENIDITQHYANDMETACSTEPGLLLNPAYRELYEVIASSLQRGNFHTGADAQKRNILRIAVQSLGSPLWGEEGNSTPSQNHSPALCRFLYALRALMRTSYAVCMLTVPTHLWQDAAYVSRLEHICDTVIRLESFAGSDNEKNPAYREYHGLFYLVKLPCINSLICHMPETLDLAFKLRKKKFMIEMLHLPPELSETVSRSQEDPVAKKTPNKLDF